MKRVAGRTARRLIGWLCLTVIILLLTNGIPLSSVQATTIGNQSYRYAQGFDTCYHPSETGLQDWWSGTPWYAYGTYLGGVGGSYVGCTPISLSTLDYAVGLGWGLIPFWYGLQMPQSCGQSYFPGTISLNTTTAYNQGVSSADTARNYAESSGYGFGDIIYFDLEGYGVTGGGCRAAAAAFINGWDHELFYNSPYYGAVYGSSCSSFLSDFWTIANVPADVAAADPNNIPEIYRLACLPDSEWNDYDRIHQFTNPISLTYNGYNMPVDEDCINAQIDSNSSTIENPNDCQYIG